MWCGFTKDLRHRPGIIKTKPRIIKDEAGFVIIRHRVNGGVRTRVKTQSQRCRQEQKFMEKTLYGVPPPPRKRSAGAPVLDRSPARVLATKAPPLATSSSLAQCSQKERKLPPPDCPLRPLPSGYRIRKPGLGRYPKGKHRRPLGRYQSPSGRHRVPSGKCQLPHGKRGFPYDKHGFPSGKRRFPSGKRCFPLGKRRLPDVPRGPT